MAVWHRSRRADLGLRAAGLLFCWSSYEAVARLVAMNTPPQTAGIAAFALAAVGFIGASGGSAFLLLGSHLFDEVDVSARWRPRPGSLQCSSLEDMLIIKSVQSAMLVIGRDVDGSWTVRESAGMLLGRFSSLEAAQRFSQADRRGITAISAGSPRRIDGRLSLSSSQVANVGRGRE